jgi:hypothetical protein
MVQQSSHSPAASDPYPHTAEQAADQSWDGIDDNDCLCVLNDYMTREMMEILSKVSQAWSLKAQEEALGFIQAQKEIFTEGSNEYQSSGKRLLCQEHVKQLSKRLGLRVGTAHYGELLYRLAYVATTADSYSEFQEKLLGREPTDCWFRNGVHVPVQRNALHPYRFTLINSPKTHISRFQEKLRSNSYTILCDLLTWFGADNAEVKSIQDISYIDLPCIFNWLLEDGQHQSVAEMAKLEATIHQHHLCSAEKRENSMNHLVLSHQFSLIQQLLEQHPVFYLLYLLLQPNEDKPLFLVSYPNPVINTIGSVRDAFTFPCNLLVNKHHDMLRAMIPILPETYDSCDYILTGISMPDDTNRFWTEYKQAASTLSVSIDEAMLVSLDPEVVTHVVAESPGKFALVQAPIPTGSIRFLSSTTATSPYGSGERLVIQPQLVPVNYSSSEAVLSNGIFLKDLEGSRDTFTPLTKTAFGVQLGQKIPPCPIADTLPSPSALSEAIQQKRSFESPAVLSEIAVLLSGDKEHFMSYVSAWQAAASTSLKLRLDAFQYAEHFAYGEKSSVNDNSDLKSDIEMVAVDSIYHEIPSDDDRLGDNERLDQDDRDDDFMPHDDNQSGSETDDASHMRSASSPKRSLGSGEHARKRARFF